MFYPRPSRALNSCSPAAFALILVGYITQQFLILLSVSHIFAIFQLTAMPRRKRRQRSKSAPAAAVRVETGPSKWRQWVNENMIAAMESVKGGLSVK